MLSSSHRTTVAVDRIVWGYWRWGLSLTTAPPPQQLPASPPLSRADPSQSTPNSCSRTLSPVFFGGKQNSGNLPCAYSVYVQALVDHKYRMSTKHKTKMADDGQGKRTWILISSFWNSVQKLLGVPRYHSQRCWDSVLKINTQVHLMWVIPDIA